MRLDPELKYYIVQHIEALGHAEAVKVLSKRLGIEKDIIRWVYQDEKGRKKAG
ncbi:hypothetical protein [Alteribacillus persepolensis]|uniref:hypothetical protein n=1 Tax=Alteribacillus persepolensis TaxID=568899 RepID=UPI001587305D|nr:hypothetical protein [Alteribacillus persepolensis]